MNIFLKFLSGLFGKKTEEKQVQTFSLGAVVNEVDTRDIPYGILATQLQKFDSFIEVPYFIGSARLLQGGLGTCVPHAFEFINRVQDNVIHSRRVPYVMTRNAIGWTEAQGQGLPQREGAKTVTVVGMPADTGLDDNTLSHKEYAKLAITSEMRTDANKYRFNGFAFPSISINGIKQALADGKLVAVTIAIDWSQIDQDGTVHPAKNVAGYHEVVIGQSDDLTGKFRFANWWGYGWGTQGDGFIKYEEVQRVIFDAIVFVELSNDLKLRAKNTQYIFLTDLKGGDNSAAVGQLQTRLKEYGLFNGIIDRKYGPITIQAVRDYQRFKGGAQTGYVGIATRTMLNEDMGNTTTLSKSKMDLWCEAIKIMEKAKPERNNPGNLRFVGQQYSVSDNGYCKFDTYEHGYDALRKLLTRACTGGSSLYNPYGSLYEFYAGVYNPKYPNNPKYKIYPGYAPKEDGNDPKGYSDFVAKYIGVDPSVEIKTLL